MVEADLFAWLVFAAAICSVGLVAAAEIALTTASRAKIWQMSEAGNRHAAVIDELLAESTQFWLTSMLLKSAGILVVGITAGRLLTAMIGPLAYLAGILLAWLVVVFRSGRLSRTGDRACGCNGTAASASDQRLHDLYCRRSPG